MIPNGLRQSVAECDAAWKNTNVYRELQKERTVDSSFTRGMERAMFAAMAAIFIGGGLIFLAVELLFRHIHISISWVH